jgi:RND family efflux transporter MFP subunit
VVRAEANLANRQALLDQERARAEQAGKDWASLGRAGTPNPLVLRTPYVAEAEANVRAAQADLSSARTTLERTRIRAPFDGLLREKRADIGQFVNVGGALGLLAAVDVAEVRLPLTEADLAMVALPSAGVAAPVRLFSRAGTSEMQWDAKLVRTEGVFDERTRVTHVVAQVSDPYALATGSTIPPLKFGSFVEGRLPANVAQPVIRVPRTALRGMDQLLLVDDDDRLRLRTVEIARTDQDQVYVASGLSAGERVITTVIEAPIDGMIVRVLDDAEAARERAPDEPAVQQSDPDVPDSGAEPQ